MATRLKPLKTLPVDLIDELLRGSIDMHVHPAPDPDFARSMDIFDMASESSRLGMRATVYKSFYFNTSAVCRLLNRQQFTAGFQTIGSVVVGDKTTGGLEYAAAVIENEAKLGCKVVWLPAFDAKWCRTLYGMQGGICLLDREGALKPQVSDILHVVKQYDLVLCSGHISYLEAKAVFTAAGNLGLSKLVATHPLAFASQYTPDQIRDLASLGVYIEHVYNSITPRLDRLDPSDYVELMQEIGPERTIMSTDGSQVMDASPAQAMRLFIGMMLQFGMRPEEVERMVKINPSELLDLNPS